MLVLAIESSTSSAKAVLYDTEKGIVASRQQSYGPKIDHGGKSDPIGVFDLTMKMAREAAQGADVQAIALCGTFHSICALDRKMEPVTPVYSWNFTGSSGLCREIRQQKELREILYHRTGCMPHSTYPRHSIQYMAREGLYLRDKYFVTQGGYNFYRLTGAFLESISTQSGSGLINLQKKVYDSFVLEYLGLRQDQLGDLVTYRDTRPLSEEGAKLLGLKSGIPVVPAHPDGALNQVGNYAQKRGYMTLSIGTSGALRVITDEPVLPKGNELWCYCGVEGWLSGAAIAGSCNCLNWFTDYFLHGQFSYAQLEQMENDSKDVPAFLPFMFGERCPGWDDARRGGFFHINPDHSVQDFYFGLQMGILFNLLQCYRVLCMESGTPEKIFVSGGIVNSERWLQMLSDIFREEIIVAEYPNASSMGAVALAMHTVGLLERIEDFSEGAGDARTILPKKNRFDYYHRQYERYLAAYDSGR